MAAVVILDGIVARASRGGDDATTGSTAPGTAQPGAGGTSTSTGPAGGAGTTLDPATAAANAKQKAAAIVPIQADAPTGYATTIDRDGSLELCTGN